MEEAAAAAESLEEQAHNRAQAVAVFRLSSEEGKPKQLSGPNVNGSMSRNESRPRRSLEKKQAALPETLDDEWEEF